MLDSLHLLERKQQKRDLTQQKRNLLLNRNRPKFHFQDFCIQFISCSVVPLEVFYSFCTNENNESYRVHRNTQAHKLSTNYWYLLIR